MTKVWIANYRHVETEIEFDGIFDAVMPYGVALLDCEPTTIDRLKALAVKEELVESGHYEDDADGQAMAATGSWIEDAEESGIRQFRFLSGDGDLILVMVIRPAFVMSASDTVS